MELRQGGLQCKRTILGVPVLRPEESFFFYNESFVAKAGVNHFLWLTKFFYRGENAFPYIDRWLEKKGEKFWEKIPWQYGLGGLHTGSYAPGIPTDFQVEVPALASKRGIQGIRTDGLPEPLISYIYRDRIAPVRTELEAFTKGSRELLTQLMLMDPRTRSEGQARALMDEILALPYHAEMRSHYR